MKTRISGIKGYLTKLEYSYENLSKEDFEHELNEVRKLLDVLENESLEYYSKQSFDTYDEAEVLPKNTDNGILYRIINTLPFMVKPVDEVGMLRENYLVNFCDERTRQLMECESLNSHNEFWKNHDTISGNVYGSMPAELVKKESLITLKSYGWDEVMVDILEFSYSNYSEEEILKYALDNFKSYIVVRESETDSILVLRYNE